MAEKSAGEVKGAMTPFEEADTRLAAMHGYAPAEFAQSVDEWEGPPLVAQGRCTVMAVKGELPPVTWDF